MAHREYRKAKDFIEDIVLSFDRELKRQVNKFESMLTKVDNSYTTANTSYRKIENIEKKVEPLQTQINELSELHTAISQAFTHNLNDNTKHNANLVSGLSSLEIKLNDITVTQEILKKRILGLEEQLEKLNVSQPSEEFRTETVLPPVPIKRDKALAALTGTEIAVLEMLSKEGPKTAPEIKERVHLSREHTARLMKKIYEEGYVEREAGKIPFRYTIKKEMEMLLQKAESSA